MKATATTGAAFIKSRLRPDCPPHFRGTGTAVSCTFFRRRPYDFFRNFLINSLLFQLLKGLFHKPVFSRMESQNGHPAARGQNIRKLFQKLIQYFKLTVYIDTQRLEGSLTGFLNSFLPLICRKKDQCFLNHSF